MNDSPSRGPRKKIVRLSEEYGLDDIGSELASMWLRPDEEDRPTLAELRDHFNQELLRAAMVEAGMNPVPGSVEYSYEYLFDDETPDSDRESARRRLEDGGVDVEKVLDDFINSSQTIHNYLREVHNVERYRGTDDRSPKEKSLERLKALNRRYETIVNDTIERLIKNGDLEDGEYDVSVECFITNTETGESRDIRDILKE
jgi:hypothetical protein